MNTRSGVFIGATATLGATLMVLSVTDWTSADPLKFAAYFALALSASGMKVVLPGINTSMSVTFVFVLLGMMELSPSETMVLGCGATLAQCFWKMNRPAKPVRVVFNVFSMMAPAVWACCWVYNSAAPLVKNSLPLMVLAAAATFFFTNTVPIAAIISLTEGKPFRKTWTDCYFWSFPYYLAGAGLVVIIYHGNQFFGWQTSLLVLPVVYWIYRSYRLYLGRLGDEKRHVEDMAQLHLRTIEALALAIDAKDHTTHDHLQRVRIYATEIGKELGLCESELEALKAASILHDIGKLAVPEHIISKPGRLTPEEFEKMKIHPVVGAKILERVKFPYDVVSIVRSHHEKWDGTGYPDGLSGDRILIGARILSAVDCLDALASDRQYRRAMPLPDAMEYVASLAGTEFDPKIVDILKRRYIELEQMAHEQPVEEERSRPMEQSKHTAAAVPAAGFQKESVSRVLVSEPDFLESIAAARHEAQILFEITHDLGNSLSLEDTLSVVSSRLRTLVPYDSIAIWITEDGLLLPKYVNGDNFRLFSSLKIPVGHGLSGWVAENSKPILNGNPSVEPGYLDDPTKFSTLCSALSVPLQGLNGTIGALTLYRTEVDAFDKDHLRILLAVSSKIAFSIENAVTYQRAQSSAVTDFLTELPNARSLFLHLSRELARCKRQSSTVGVLVCDLDNFKEINDRFGHLEGNKVLRAFAHALREDCRQYDYVARMGGDEFVIIAPGLTAEAAEVKARHISDLATEAARKVCGEAITSASVGSAFYPVDGTDPEEVLSKADRRMYSAKHKTRAEIASSQAAGEQTAGNMLVN
jgi:diguanylate cyclase (GGDEF)-like protein/putative nucleotidyltransferase with HDIG domain